MDPIPIRLERIERAERGSQGIWFRVTFRIGTGDQQFDVPLWVGSDVPEEEVLRLGRAQLHKLSSQLAHQTKDW